MDKKFEPTEKVLQIQSNVSTHTLESAANSKGGHQHTLLGMSLIHPNKTYAGLKTSVQCNSINVYMEIVENVINTCLRAANSPCKIRAYRLNDKFLQQYGKFRLLETLTQPRSADEYDSYMFIMDVVEVTSPNASTCTITFHKLNENDPRVLTISHKNANSI